MKHFEIILIKAYLHQVLTIVLKFNAGRSRTSSSDEPNKCIWVSKLPTTKKYCFHIQDLTCSFFALTSESREPWRASSWRCWFFLTVSISSSLSANLRSKSCLTWVSSSWTLRTLPSSASKAPSASCWFYLFKNMKCNSYHTYTDALLIC